MNSPISFSRSGRSDADGKKERRISAEVSDRLAADIGDVLEKVREQRPTATLAEVVRMIFEEDLNGHISTIALSFPAVLNMNLEEAERTFAALAGKSLEEYQLWVRGRHIFGRLHVDQMIEEAGAEGQPENCPGSGRILVGEGT